MNPTTRVQWIRLVIALVVILALSFGLAYFLNRLIVTLNIEQYKLAWLAYSIVFGAALVSNFTIIAPVPFAVSIMIAAATEWNPVMIALVASIGGTLGELSGYLAGYLGKKIAISDNILGHSRVQRWIGRYGIWAISVLAIQPIIPFDIGGLVAGALRMPVHKFLLALWLGKFPKYLILTYAGIGVIHFIPFLGGG